jgi:KaiC/GvpD/RAD55 family RecA-like ATPase
MKRTFRFGISALDLFMKTDERRVIGTTALTGCVIGPDGCGKSLLAMHVASTYWSDVWAQNQEVRPCVIYVSTDFSFEQADRAWMDFGLDFPVRREESIKKAYDQLLPSAGSSKSISLETPLTPVSPTGLTRSEYGSHADPKDIAKIFQSADSPSVYFLDLQRETAGDDWTYLNHLVGLLPECDVPHLLIVDAIEGLEAFVGEHDGFGERRTRRSRIAQLIRSCATAKSHVLFVVEEPERNARLPEQFVTDLVVRLRVDDGGGYSIRTLEIEKCRGVPHVRGSHEFYIRSGKGTQTGEIGNVDHPQIEWKPPVKGRKQSHLAHFYVVPSIHYWNNVVQSQRLQVPVANGIPDFGIDGIEFKPRTPGLKSGEKYVHNGSVTVLFGDAETNKSRLARAFLAQAFNKRPVENQGVAVYISTSQMDSDHLLERLGDHLDKGAHIPPNRVLCRRLSVRYLSSAQFLAILEAYIHKAQRMLVTRAKRGAGIVEESDQIRQRAFQSSLIRVVVDDWSHLLAMHPNIDQDPLLLPSFVATLKREGVSALIVSTQPGQPLVDPNTIGPRDLRKLDEHKVFTWTVPFFGEGRTAITTSASITNEKRIEINELRLKSPSTESLEIGRHFALYSGLQNGDPKRVPLVLRLYGGPHAGRSDGEESAAAFPRVLKRTLAQLFPSSPGQDVVTFEPYENYDDYFAFADWLDETRLEHTVVFQIDEFWSDDKTSLADLSGYLHGEAVAMVEKDKVSGLPQDEHRVFQPHRSQLEPAKNPRAPRISAEYALKLKREGEKFYRADMFQSAMTQGPEGLVDRIPFLWDFGLILARKDLWERSQKERLGEGNSKTVGQIWNALCIKGADDEIKAPIEHGTREAENLTERDRLPAPANASRANEALAFTAANHHGSAGDDETAGATWAEFFQACRIVAQHSSVVAFDVDLNTAESLSSLVLEVWASMSFRCRGANSPFMSLVNRALKPDKTLKGLLNDEPLILYLACEQLLSACGHLRSANRQVSRAGEHKEAAASREWYSTAAAIVRKQRHHQYRLLRLPGHFSARGDWFLSLAKGSRSELLGHRTIDILSSRRMSLLRLHDGLGLPTRDILPDGQVENLQTAISRVHPSTQEVSILTYGEICECGVTKENQRSFHWLWRSRLRHYDRDCFYWRRWVARLFAERQDWLPADYLSLLEQTIRESGLKDRRTSTNWENWEAGERPPEYEKFLKKRDILAAALRD